MISGEGGEVGARVGERYMGVSGSQGLRPPAGQDRGQQGRDPATRLPPSSSRSAHSPLTLFSISPHQNMKIEAKDQTDFILDSIDHTSPFLCYSLLQDLVDCQVDNPETKSSEDDTTQEDGDRPVEMPKPLEAQGLNFWHLSHTAFIVAIVEVF